MNPRPASQGGQRGEGSSGKRVAWFKAGPVGRQSGIVIPELPSPPPSSSAAPPWKEITCFSSLLLQAKVPAFRKFAVYIGSSVQSLNHVRLCNPMDCSTPGLPVHHHLPEFTQTHVHQVGDAIQPFHPLSSPSPPTFSLSQHQGLFK